MSMPWSVYTGMRPDGRQTWTCKAVANDQRPFYDISNEPAASQVNGTCEDALTQTASTHCRCRR